MADKPFSAPCLDGLCVLDMSRIVAGPLAGQILADFGAEVIKVERPVGGDDLRTVGPPWTSGTDASQGHSTYFDCVNRNKRSIAVDFSRPEGQRIIRALAAKADVVIENYRTGNLAKYGLAYADLRSVNPGIIYCSVTGFGQTGPLADRPGYDYLVQAMSGLMSITGPPDGSPGAGPMRVGVPICDVLAGQNAVVGILLALHRREQTGQGAYLDISLFESQLAALMNPASAWLNGANPWPRSGNDHPNAVPYGAFEAADGQLMIATFTDREFVRFAEAVGAPEWASDPRFAKTAGRVANRTLLVDLITRIIGRRSRAEWIDRLSASNIPCGSILEIGEALENEHVRHRGMVLEIDRPAGPPLQAVASPIKMTDEPSPQHMLPPDLGEHTRQTLTTKLGLSEAELIRLQTDGII